MVPGLFDAAELGGLRAALVDVMYRHDWIAGPGDTTPGPRAQRDGGDGWWQGYTQIQRLEALHALGHGTRLLALMTGVLGAEVLSHNRRVVSLTLPGYGVPPHQDYVSVQGSADTLTVWVPLGDRAAEPAAIALLPLGDEPGLHELAWRDGISAGIAAEPGSGWEQPSLAVGDAVIYHGLTVHELLPNRDGHYRISCELRFQPRADPVCRASMKPHHYPRVPGWPSLTGGWQTTRWITAEDGVTLAPFRLPRQIDRWHTDLTVPPSRLLRPAAAARGGPGGFR